MKLKVIDNIIYLDSIAVAKLIGTPSCSEKYMFNEILENLVDSDDLPDIICSSEIDELNETVSSLENELEEEQSITSNLRERLDDIREEINNVYDALRKCDYNSKEIDKDYLEKQINIILEYTNY